MKWIKCSEQMPEYKEQVLVYGKQFAYAMLLEGEMDKKRVKGKIVHFKNPDTWLDMGGCCYCMYPLHMFTHWMPLPEGPE